MPCGGIYPLEPGEGMDAECFYCLGSLNTQLVSFIEEWDAYIHDYCIDSFLRTPEGKIVIAHGHTIERR